MNLIVGRAVYRLKSSGMQRYWSDQLGSFVIFTCLANSIIISNYSVIFENLSNIDIYEEKRTPISELEECICLDEYFKNGLEKY